MTLSLRQRGDTLVEVLIAIAVLAAVLGGAYASANRSLQTTRQTQERGEALKLAESQLEKLRGAAAGSVPAGSFCFNAGAVPTSSTPCAESFGGGITYNAVITRQGSPPHFVIRIEWASIRGSGNDSVEIRYRTE